MSTQRYISTSFWDDRWIRTLDPSERYLYLYLLTNTLTKISGIYQITLDRIAYDTGYDERTLRPMLERFKKAGKAVFVADEWMILPSWPKHQKWEVKQTIKTGIDSALKSVPKSILLEAKHVSYTYPIDSLLVGYTYQPSYSDSDLHSDSDSDIDTNTQECAREEVPQQKEPEPLRPDFNPALHPEIKAPMINWPDLYTAWMKTPGTADPGLFRFCQITARKLIPLFSGLTAEQVFKAVENYQDALSRPTWWTTSPGIVQWAEKHIDRFLPGNYNPDEYRKEETAQEANERYVQEAMEKLNASNT